MEKLIIAGREFGSRLFLGTGKFRNSEEMSQAIAASGTEMVTVAMKRIELGDSSDDMLSHIKRDGLQLLPTPLACATPTRRYLPRRCRARLSARSG